MAATTGSEQTIDFQVVAERHAQETTLAAVRGER
jgi:hypothetical protein